MRGRQIDRDDVSETEKGLRVTYRNMKTGLVEKRDPYILRFVGEGSSKRQYWERPAGSGNLWSQPYGGEAIGRWDAKKPEGERFLEGAPHVEFTPPETADQKLAREYAQKDVKIKELEAELAAIRMESDKKAASAKKPQGA